MANRGAADTGAGMADTACRACQAEAVTRLPGLACAAGTAEAASAAPAKALQMPGIRTRARGRQLACAHLGRARLGSVVVCIGSPLVGPRIPARADSRHYPVMRFPWGLFSTPRSRATTACAALTLAVTLALVPAALVPERAPELLQRLDLWLYDRLVQTSIAPSPRPAVTIVAIDEPSLARIGQWPWPRDRMAELVARLFDTYGVQVLALDTVFAEPDRSDAAAIRAAIGRAPPAADPALRREVESALAGLDRDAIFAQALQGRPVVLGYYFTRTGGPGTGALPEPGWLPRAVAGELGIRAPEFAGYGANLPALMRAAGAAGHFTRDEDVDKVTRRLPMLVAHGDSVYTSLALEVLLQVAGNVPIGVPPAGPGEPATALQIGERLVLPIDPASRVLVPFYGPPGTIDTLSAADVLEGRADPARLRGRIVVFGPTAPGLRDSVPTPLGGDRVFPGVEVHASVIQGALDGRLPSQPWFTNAAVLGLLGGVALVMLVAARGLRLRSFALTTGVLALSLLAAGWLLWSRERWVLPLALPLVQLAALFVGLNLLAYLFETRGRRALGRLFGQYVPPELVEEMNADPARYSMSGHSAELSVMFADVRGFTTLSEQMQPQALGELMNTLLTELSRVIRADHRGTIDKYIGDCVMAFWGAPVPRPDHAAAAVAAALDMQRALVALIPGLTLPGGAQLAVGIGVNTGPAVVGNMGSAYRMAYTVLGDTVNTASRLEGLTKAYGAGIVAGESVRQAAGADFLWRELDRVRVKGRETPLSIHEPVARAQEASPAQRERAQRHEAALAAWRESRFDESLQAWQALHEEEPCLLYALWIERAQRLRDEPPGSGWDGVYTFETK